MRKKMGSDTINGRVPNNRLEGHAAYEGRLDPKAGHLPAAALIANRPLESAWHAAVELSAVRDRMNLLEARIQALEEVAKRANRPGGKRGTAPTP